MTIGRFLYFLVSVATAIIGFNIHHSIFWSIMDFFFTPFTWLKWLVCQEVTLNIIKGSFEFLNK